VSTEVADLMADIISHNISLYQQYTL
jgi:hypothetical protein